MHDYDAFAAEWIEAWNSHDLDRILAHYSQEIVFVSPRAAVVVPDSGGEIRGGDALRRYWRAGLDRNPELHFRLEAVLATVSGATLLYRNQIDQLVAETMLFDSKGLVRLGVAAYG